MKDQLSDEQNAKILAALDEAIQTGPWDKSNFLSVIGKNLRAARDDFAAQIGASSPAQVKADAALAKRMALRSGQQEVYVSLYSSDGNSLQAWEKIIANLPGQMISRPVYAEEADIKSLIKTKENKQNEAYVAIYINQSDILPLHPDKALTDKLGKKLLSLKDKTLDLDNVSRFVHTSGEYQWERGRLHKFSGI